MIRVTAYGKALAIAIGSAEKQFGQLRSGGGATVTARRWPAPQVAGVFYGVYYCSDVFLSAWDCHVLCAADVCGQVGVWGAAGAAGAADEWHVGYRGRWNAYSGLLSAYGEGLVRGVSCGRLLVSGRLLRE